MSKRFTAGPHIRRTQWSVLEEQREEAIVGQILEYLTLKGYWAWRTHDARHKPVCPGIPDIMAVLPQGQLLAVEVKADDGTVSVKQEEFHRELYRRRARVIVARSLDDVMAAGL